MYEDETLLEWWLRTGYGEHLAQRPREVPTLLPVDVVQIVNGLVQPMRPQGGVRTTRLPDRRVNMVVLKIELNSRVV